MRNVALRAVALLAAFSLAACGGGGGSGSVPSTPLSGGAATRPVGGGDSTSAIPYGRAALAGAAYVGPARLGTVGLDVYVQMRDNAGLLQYARNANDPRSPLFRHWLTPAELGDRFGATKGDYDAVVAHLLRYGIAVKTYPQRQMLRLRGPQAGVERALGLSFGLYRKKGQVFFAPSSDPHPPAALRIAALGNAVGYVERFRNIVPVRIGTNLVQGYAPQQIAAAFDYTGAYRAGFRGHGITIGVIGTGPITDGDPRVQPGDAAVYRSQFGVGGSGAVVQDFGTNANVSPGNPAAGLGFSSGLATPPPVTSSTTAGCTAQHYDPNSPPTYNITNYTTCNPEDVESQLDTEQASSLAPDALVNFYIAYNPNECFAPGTCANNPPTPALGIALADDETQQAIGDDLSDIVTMSFGGDEPSSYGVYFGSNQQGFGPTEFASLVSEGIAVFASSGDSGAEGCGSATQLCVEYPATDPSVVSVGGVNSPLDTAGQLTGPLTGWGLQTKTGGGSGGGCSAYFTAPAYEAGIAGFPCAGKRAQPDASLDADINTGVSVFYNVSNGLGGGLVAAVGGTSVSAPEMAAMWALVLQACSTSAGCRAHGSGAKPYRLGNPNAYLYPVYGNAKQYAATFYDVQYGSNALPSGSGSGAGYTAGVGYDLVTGIGVPFGRNLIRAVAGV